jgi:hypothetical protein
MVIVGAAASGASAIRFARNAIGDYLILGALIVAAATMAPRLRTATSALPRAVYFAAASFALAGLLTAPTALDPGFHLLAVVDLLLLAVGIPIVLMTVAGRRELLTIASAYVVVAALSGVLAVFQALDLVGGAVDGRGVGLSLHANNVGHLAALAVPTCLWLARSDSRWLGALAALILGAVASGSRGGMLGAAAGIMLHAVIVWRRRPAGDRSRRRLAIVGAATVVGCAALLLSGVPDLDRIVGESSALSIDERFDRLLSAADDVASSPYIGVGFRQSGRSHNLYAETARALGGIGVIGLFAVPVAAVWAYRKYRRSNGSSATFVDSVFVTTVVWTLVAATTNNFFDAYMWLPIGLSLAALPGAIPLSSHGE